MHYPIAVIDFEASSLDRLSYPIEVGLATIDAQGSGPRIWSTLVKPTQQWLDSCGWDPDAERVHGIRPYELRHGAHPDSVATDLNKQLASIGQVWCDGGHYDALWQRALFEAAGIAPACKLCHLAELFNADAALALRYHDAISASVVLM